VVVVLISLLPALLEAGTEHKLHETWRMNECKTVTHTQLTHTVIDRQGNSAHVFNALLCVKLEIWFNHDKCKKISYSYKVNLRLVLEHNLKRVFNQMCFIKFSVYTSEPHLSSHDLPNLSPTSLKGRKDERIREVKTEEGFPPTGCVVVDIFI